MYICMNVCRYERTCTYMYSLWSQSSTCMKMFSQILLLLFTSLIYSQSRCLGSRGPNTPPYCIPMCHTVLGALPRCPHFSSPHHCLRDQNAEKQGARFNYPFSKCELSPAMCHMSSRYTPRVHRKKSVLLWSSLSNIYLWIVEMVQKCLV